jgi:hypothetical protein
MANMARDRESQIEQDKTARLADVLGALARTHDEAWFAGLFAELVQTHDLRWSSLGGKPVTQRGDLEDTIESWLRDG